MRDGLNARISLVLHSVLLDSHLQSPMQSFNVSNHAGAGQDASFSEFDCFRLGACEDVVTIAHSSVSSDSAEVLASDG